VPGGGAGTRSFLAGDGVPLACFTFEERLREDAAAAVQALHDDGVRVCLLSGDTVARARNVGAALGLTATAGALTPQGKLRAVQGAQRKGHAVGMLGDGVNDAPVLAQADVSLAMGEGALVARTQADGVLASHPLGDGVL